MASITFISHVGFSTTILALVLDSLVRVSRRVGKNHFDKIAQSPSSHPTPRQQEFIAALSPLLASCDSILSHRSALRSRFWQLLLDRTVEFISTASASTISSLLTLFSKCFSSFLHSTCSLSVSCQYLALDEIYHPFWAAFPNNPTLGERLVEEPRRSQNGILTLSDALFQGT